MRPAISKAGCVALAVAALALLAFAAPAMAELAPFGLKSFEVAATEAPAVGQAPDAFGRVLGPADLQAGSHPYALTTTFVLNGPEFIKSLGSSGVFVPAGKGLKDARVQLPPGFVGNPNATPKCSYADFNENECPNDTVVGVAGTILSHVTTKGSGRSSWYRDPIYNLETPGGVPAEFGYYAAGTVPILIDASVRTGSDYGVTADVRNIPQVEPVWASTVTIWGVPAEASHNRARGTCLSTSETFGEGEPGEGLWGKGKHFLEEESTREAQENFDRENGKPLINLLAAECPAEVPVQPLLTNPTSCGEAREVSLSVDDWETPGNLAIEPGTLPGEKVFTKHAALPKLSGCEELDFSPGLSVQPDGTAGSTPTGLNVGVHVSQESTTNPKGLGEADVKDTTVALPPGVQVSPSASDGLEACSNAEIGFEGYRELDESGRQTPVFTPGAPSCPDASKIASVRIATPLLEHELTGAVYLAAPQNFKGLPENPFESLIAMYLVAEEPLTGVLVKLPGKVSLNEETGQITTTFENTPQLPFSELKLEFFGTARAPLATPSLCGTYNTESSFVPWSGTPAVSPPASFQITSGPNGSPCADPLPFSPSLASGTTNNNAGAFSALETTLGREDGQQPIQSVTLHYPPGLSGLLAGVELCHEAQANAGTCGPNSQIGETIVSVGLGSDPFTVTGGKAYITGPYNGTSTCTVGSPGCAPFGLSIVNPAKAGPFDLQEGRPVVVRAKIEVDPHTAALTVTTNPSGAYAIPHMIEGIPLQIKHVNVNVNRPGFTFNPTSCTPTKVESTIASAEGANSTVSTPFQVASCASLKFAPDFKVSTQGKTSKAKGASLTTTILYPPGQNYANIAKVKVELPKALPSRLTTLQKACTAAQFNANPAGCPAASVIGHAKAVTPLLPVPLEGPAYFVSNGGEAFPNLIMVLQGYGVTIDLVGDTFISKSGITSSTFKTVPDQPVTSFELTLPEGPYSALAANGNLCTQKLTMPTEFVAQNGAEIHENTAIAVTGCKPAITVTSHRVKGKTATIQVSVPSAGKLLATAKGLSKGTARSAGAGAVTVKLSLSGREKAFLAKHRGRRLKAKVNLTFTPKAGSKLKTGVTVLIG
jgi:hypothetical protein